MWISTQPRDDAYPAENDFAFGARRNVKSNSFHPARFCDRIFGITIISYSKMKDNVGSVRDSKRGSPQLAWTENRRGYKSKWHFLVAKSNSKFLVAKFTSEKFQNRNFYFFKTTPGRHQNVSAPFPASETLPEPLYPHPS